MRPTLHKEAKRQSNMFWIAAGLLIAAVLIGGGGVAYGLHNAIVQWAALAALAVSFPAFLAFWTKAPIGFRLLCAASISLPLLHLLPMPPAIWQPLPGRELISPAQQKAG